MVSYLTNGLWYATDKLGDATLWALDEFKFWGEVVSEFFELEGKSSDAYLQEYRKEIREQLQETEELQKEVDQMLREQDQLELAEAELADHHSDEESNLQMASQSQ